jgi:pimeloyl-ACP methyl ester carboxylesterase
LRLASAVNAVGYPALITSYLPVTVEDSVPARHGFGYDEWQDLDAALDLARGRGATSFVLVGYGSGASIVGVYLYESATPESVVAVVLDAPLLSLRTMIHDTWVDQGVPGWTIGWTKALASMRFGIDLGEIDHIERIDEWRTPVLIMHGRDDEVYPLGIAETFALSKPDEALLLTFPGAGYGTSWNVDRERYETAVLGFLNTHAPLFEAVSSPAP